MPIPIILGGIAIAGALFGAKKGIDGLSDFSTAKEIAQKAKNRHSNAKGRATAARSKVNKAAEAYGKHLLRVSDTTVREMVEFLEKLDKRSDIRRIDVLEKVGFSDRDVGEYQQRILDAETLLGGVGGAAMTGAGAGASTLALVGLLGTASTGTAISTLGGAAATNATLAWLGGVASMVKSGPIFRETTQTSCP